LESQVTASMVTVTSRDFHNDLIPPGPPSPRTKGPDPLFAGRTRAWKARGLRCAHRPSACPQPSHTLLYLVFQYVDQHFGKGSIIFVVLKLLLFPHDGFVSATEGPHGHPGTLYSFPLALSIAVAQWAVVALGLAWFTKAMSPWKQFLMTVSIILVVGLLVLIGGFLMGGGQISM
jgi:hypothetical protein